MAELSVNNILFEVQKDVCALLNANEQLSAIHFIPENAMDTDFQITKALKQQGICGLVMTPEATYQGDYSDKSLVWQLENLTIQVVENVEVNRAIHTKSKLTGQDAAMLVMEVLGKQNHGKFAPMNYNQGEESGLLVNKCTFRCMVQ